MDIYILFIKSTEIIMKHNTFLIYQINLLTKDMKSLIMESDKNKLE
jgi:hypothetical protein